MPVSMTMTKEVIGPDLCERCGAPSEILTRFYIEAGRDLRGHSPALCPHCQAVEDDTQRFELDAPPEEKGPRPPSRQLRKASQRQELETASLIGGRRQKASGACVGSKGDVRLAGVLRGEEKLTKAGSITIKREWLDKIRSECTGREKPFLHVRFINPITLAAEDDWVMIPIEDWEHSNAAT